MALRANRAYLLRIVDLEVVDPDWMPAAAMHLLFRHLDFEKLYAHDLSSKGATRRFRRPLPPLHLSANKPPAMAVQRLPPAEARTYKLNQMVRLVGSGEQTRWQSQECPVVACRRGWGTT